MKNKGASVDVFKNLNAELKLNLNRELWFLDVAVKDRKAANKKEKLAKMSKMR